MKIVLLSTKSQPIMELEIKTPGTREDMENLHKARRGYTDLASLQNWTRRYTKGAHRILQKYINTMKRLGNTRKRLRNTSREIVQAIDKDTVRLAKKITLWRAMRPQPSGGAEALKRYQDLLEAVDVGYTIEGAGFPFSTSADPVLSADAYGSYVHEKTKRFGIVIKVTAPEETPVVITNPEEAEYIIGSGYALYVERVGRNVPVKCQNFKSTPSGPAKTEEVVADCVIYATIVKTDELAGLFE